MTQSSPTRHSSVLRRGRAGAADDKLRDVETVSSAGAMNAMRKPRNLEELRELVVRIRRDEAEVSLGGKAFDVRAKLVAAPEQAAVRTISELGAVLSVNASPLTRFATRPGFYGSHEFQTVSRQDQ